MAVKKACPIVLRRTAGRREVLAFVHPLAGKQLIKGTIERGESADAAALRELQEEAGIAQAVVRGDLGCWDAGFKRQTWSFYLCEVATPLPDTWRHFASDDGGQIFTLFWQALEEAPLEGWHPVHARALAWLRKVVADVRAPRRRR